MKPFGSRYVRVLAAALAAVHAGCFIDVGAMPAGGAGAAGTAGATGGTGAATSGEGLGGGAGTGGAGAGGSGNTGGSGDTGGGGGGDPMCGDDVLADSEECEDGNDIEGDGCFECRRDCGCPGCEVGKACTDCGPGTKPVMFKDPVTKHCYLFVEEYKSWTAARDRCQAWDGDLAGLSTAGEMQTILDAKMITLFLDGDPNDNARSWTGGNDREEQGDYEWANGEDWLGEPDGPSWGPGEPNGGDMHDCLVIAVDGKVRDRDCQDAHPFLCEREP